jgi:hypothetical protein
MGWRRGQAYSQDLRDRVLAAEGSAPAVAVSVKKDDVSVMRSGYRF